MTRAAAILAFCVALSAGARAQQVVTVIENLGPVALTQGSMVTVPPTGGASGDGYNAVTLALQLPLADKLAVGNTLYLEADVSTDGGQTFSFVSSTNWTSYGPGGLTVHLPGGRTLVNPDPTLGVGLNGLSSALYRIKYQTNNLTTATPVITGFKD